MEGLEKGTIKCTCAERRLAVTVRQHGGEERLHKVVKDEQREGTVGDVREWVINS